ncbi:MAG: ATP-grasp domain-containing protein [Candidatus Aureabacteria bacterium]|nr:ATP-grasp domain-containing protein [Candidatus Auribacterota bacterium]
MQFTRRERVAIIYNSYYPEGILPPHERDAGESIVDDAERVRDILTARGARVVCIPFRRSARDFLRRLLSCTVDLVFNLCEEALGDSRNEMSVCALLDLVGLPHTGCGPLTLGLALDKALTKKLLLSEGIPTPRYFVIEDGAHCTPPHGMSFPLFVKPLREDASLGIDRRARVTNRVELAERCRFVIRHYRQPALVEKYIEGRELNISVLGNRKPVALPISEIDMRSIPQGAARVCDYRAKWVPESEEYSQTVPRCPALLEHAIERRINTIALTAYRLMSCRGYARIDIRLGRRGVPYVLEVNPNPSIGPDAGIVRSAAAAGISYPELICRIANLALYGD